MNDHAEKTKSIARRDLLAAGGLGVIGAAVAAQSTAHANATPAAQAPQATDRPQLKFGKNGKFKVIQFNDTQDDQRTDRRTIETMERIIDAERPQFVVINGDVITDGPTNKREVKQALNNVVLPMEARRIPWAITFGNHDEDSLPRSGVDEAAMLAYVRTFQYNLNAENTPGVTGTSNTYIPVTSRDGRTQAYGIWLLDSGGYAPKEIAGQDFAGYPDWDWLRMDQLVWYRETSRAVEAQCQRKVPSLMFLHIPLWEHRFMWFGGVDTRTPADAARGKARHNIAGERNESESPGPFNSGLFNALLERGDVQGVFCGHDHINTYVGNYYGIQLGFAPGTGFGTYGLPGPSRNRLRGGRVFELTEANDGVQIDSKVRFASEFGIDLTPNDQPMKPFLLDEEIGRKTSSLRVTTNRTTVTRGDQVRVDFEVTPHDPTGWAIVFVDGIGVARVNLRGHKSSATVRIPDDAGDRVTIEVAYRGDEKYAGSSSMTRVNVTR